MNILGIESSCDETGVAVYSSTRGLLADKLHSQVTTHAEYGGVVPELASRDHVRRLATLTRNALADAGLERTDLDGIAYTAGPGLVGALLVGASYAQAMAGALGVPALGVHHMEGHLLAPMLETPAPKAPYVALLVSGGHTMLVDVARIGAYEEIGNTLDDAAGEAFDKTAKLLDLGYPGGPAIAELAEHGDDRRFRFPRPMTDRPGLEFSFSGLKTFTRTLFQQQGEVGAQTRADIAAGFERAVAETLTIKCRRALQQTGRKQLIIAGGVGANKRLRAALEEMCAQQGAKLFCPRLEFCTDNGAMIAHAGAVRLLAGQHDGEATIKVRARWPLHELSNVEATA